jgi:hypothetical protein
MLRTSGHAQSTRVAVIRSHCIRLLPAVNPGFQFPNQRERCAIIRLEGAQFEHMVGTNLYACAFPFAAIAIDHRHNSAGATCTIDIWAICWFAHTFLIPTGDG